MYLSLFALAAIFASAVIADPSPPLPTGCVQNSKNCGLGKPLNNATIPIFTPGLKGPGGIPGPTAVPIPKGGGAGGGAGAGKDGGGAGGGKNGDVILSTVTFTTCVPTVKVTVITVKPSPSQPAAPKRPAQPSAGIPNKPAPPIFSGAASVARSSSPFVVIAGAVVFLL